MQLEKNNRIKFFNSIVFKVTLWYSVFIIILITIMISTVFIISSKSIRENNLRNLVESVEKMSENAISYEYFDDGVLFSIYDENGNLVEKNFPKGFDDSIPFSDEEVKEYTISDKKYLYFDKKIVDSQQWVRGIIQLDHGNEEISELINTVLIVSPLVIFIMIFGGYIILKRAFLPVRKISKTAVDIQCGGDFSKRIPIGEKQDELNALAGTFNDMISSIEETFEREKQLNNDVSHELRTPISVILSESEYSMKYSSSLDESKESCKIINNQAKKMKEMISQIMDIARLNRNIEFKEINISNILKEKSLDYKNLVVDRKIDIDFDIEDNCIIYGNQLLFERLFDNLFSNAIKFSKNRISVILKKNEDKIFMKIIDDGIGIPVEMQSKIWDRFYQVDASRNNTESNGCGLGLSLVKKITQIHNWDISVESAENNGTSFTVKF